MGNNVVVFPLVFVGRRADHGQSNKMRRRVGSNHALPSNHVQEHPQPIPSSRSLLRMRQARKGKLWHPDLLQLHAVGADPLQLTCTNWSLPEAVAYCFSLNLNKP
jgi:hypothetical protein